MGVITLDNGHNGVSKMITRDHFDSMLVEMRVIDAVEASTELNLYGEAFSTPVMIAAISGVDEKYPDGMADIAKAVAATNGVMWTGMGTEDDLQALLDTGARTIKIVKPYEDTDLIFERLEMAERCGAFAVGMDVDSVFGDKRTHGYAREYRMSPKSLDQIKSYVKSTKLPFILKGILSETDAKKALEAGAAGIVVSHHSGVIDYAVPPLAILPKIAAIVNKSIPIFVDCSITRGMDVFKALALGASAVCVGHAVIDGLAQGGYEGAKKVLEDINDELRWVMSHTNSPDVGHIDPSVLW